MARRETCELRPGHRIAECPVRMSTRIPDISHRTRGAAHGRGRPSGGVDSPSVEWLPTFAQFRFMPIIYTMSTKLLLLNIALRISGFQLRSTTPCPALP